MNHDHEPADPAKPGDSLEDVADLEWMFDPTELALGLNAWGANLPEAFCAEIGRRLLLAELEFSEWVLRRIERVKFEGDETVSRQISVELNVRNDAPIFVDNGGRRYWLVPLSMVRRRTLLNFDVRNEQGQSVSTPDISLTQQFDQSILLAAAETTGATSQSRQDQTDVRTFIRDIVSGTQDNVFSRMIDFEGFERLAEPHAERPEPRYLGPLFASPLFSAMLYRLRKNNTLYVFLAADEGRRHRVLQISFDEPTDWTYQVPTLRSVRGTGPDLGLMRILNLRVPRWERTYIAAAFGLIPTRLRFQIPSAQNAASYHFEVTAPHGVRIVEASLLAGRPNDPSRHVSADRVIRTSTTVGLRAIQVPSWSLCLAQVDLRVTSGGWLSTLVVSCWLVFCVLLSVCFHWFVRPPHWSESQVTNIVLLLITTSAGLVALIVQQDFRGLSARMVTRLRGLGAIAIALPVPTAGFLVYAGQNASAHHQEIDRIAILMLTGFSFLIAALVTTVWRLDRRSRGNLNRRDPGSPWDLTSGMASSGVANAMEANFSSAYLNYGYTAAAIGIQTAEGWDERYAWTDSLQRAAIHELRALATRRIGVHHVLDCIDLDTACSKSDGCAARRASRENIARRRDGDGVGGSPD